MTTSNVDEASLTNAADAALRAGDYPTAVACLREIVARRPDDVRVLLNLGGALKELGRFDDAHPLLARAVSLDPQRFGAWSNLGSVSLELQRYDDAIAAFSNAIRLKNDHVPALAGMGVTLRRRGEPRKALPFFDLAVAGAPADPDIRTWRAIAYLAHGDYVRGFGEYEWRRHASSFRDIVVRAPFWRGEPLSGRTLLIHGEGGLGDCLQFCRYIPMLGGLSGRIAVQMPQPLVRLLSRHAGFGSVISSEMPSPFYDLACSVMSLPYVFQTSLETVPFANGYLQADANIQRRWHDLLEQDAAAWRDRHGAFTGAPLKVGLVWSGGKRPWHLENTLVDQRRSMDLSDFAPLATVPNVLFYSLQLGESKAQAEHPPHGLHLIDHTALIEDFDDTAGLVSLLDLIIAVDTSTAHLSAALGRPTWVLSRYDQCWRWLTGATHSPWYSHVSLYTQTAPLSWAEPLERVVADLRALTARSGASQRSDDVERGSGI